MLTPFFVEKVILSLLVGALLGLEREYTKKQVVVGLRTFSLISLLGALSVIISERFGDPNYLLCIIGFAFICTFAVSFYLRRLRARKPPGFTTNISLVITFVLGVMVGLELFTESVFLAIVIAIVLFSRERLHTIVKNLTEKEVIDLLEFLVLLGIVYPFLPRETTIAEITFPLFMIWSLAVAISLINFVVFIFARHLKPKKQIEALSFLSGFVSLRLSTAAMLNLRRENKKLIPMIIPGLILATAAAFIRNFVLILAPAPQTIPYLVPALLVGVGSALVFSFLLLKKKQRVAHIHIKSPFNVIQAVKLALIILVLYVGLSWSQELESGFLFPIAFIGGMLSTSATSISLAGLVTTEAVQIAPVCFGVLIMNVGSAISNIALCYIAKAPELVKAWLYLAVSFALMFGVLALLTGII